MYVAAWMLRPNWKGHVRLSLWEWQGVETEESRCCFSASGRGWAVLTLAGGEGQPDTGQGEYHQQQQKKLKDSLTQDRENIINNRKTLGATECFQTVGKLLSSSHQSCKRRRRRGHKFAKTLFKAENFSTSKKLSSPYFKTPSRSSSGTLDSLGGEGEVNLNYWGILRIAPRSTGWVGGTWAALCTELANIAVCLQAWQGWHCNVYLKWSLRPRGKFHVLGTFGNCVTASLSRASLPLWINLDEI